MGKIIEQCEDVRHTLGMKNYMSKERKPFGTTWDSKEPFPTYTNGRSDEASNGNEGRAYLARMNLKKTSNDAQKAGRKRPALISTFLSFWANDCCKQRKMVLGQQS